MKRLRAFLLIMLMLAVPLQALAGKALVCESMHTGMVTPESMVHEVHAMSMQEHGSHHASVQHGQDHHAGTAHHAVNDSDSLEQHAGSCNLCASCPVGSVGMAMNEFRLHSPTVPSTDIAYFAFYIPQIDPDLPEDPPRT